MKPALTPPIFYLITKGECTPENFDETGRQVIDIVRAAVDAGVGMVQIREKHLTAKLLFELVSRAVETTRGSETRLLVNDRVDITLAAGADGVQLTERSMRPEVVRSIVGNDFMIGASVHSLESARKARDKGADFVVFGPVFETPAKGEGQGIETLTGICDDLLPSPVIAIGGIDQVNYQQVLATGATGVAAIRWLNDAGRLRGLS